jgi:putative RNA 2'-phosphotransferase
MTDPIAVCPAHGPHATAGCPHCGARGERLLDGRRRRRLSTFCSGALRHFPDDAGIVLDEAGWTPLDALVDAVDRRYDWAGDREVRAVVATDPKGRFETRGVADDAEVRAAYGHSVDVDLDRDREDDPGDDVPETLYHGTAPRTLDAISDEGLRPMGRQEVHLSGDPETAASVGRRHAAAEPAVLVVDAAGLAAAGFEIRTRGRETYTVARVPPRFLSRAGTT